MSAQRDIPIVNTRRHFVKEFFLPAATESRSVAFVTRQMQAHNMTSFNAIKLVPGVPMRTTLALDDDLVRIAQEFTGVAEKTALVREALKALIERESARRLASLGGTMPQLKNVPRRRVRPSRVRPN